MLDRVVDLAAIEPGMEVMELRPGTGNLTQRLVDAGAAEDAAIRPVKTGRAFSRLTLPHTVLGTTCQVIAVYIVAIVAGAAVSPPWAAVALVVAHMVALAVD